MTARGALHGVLVGVVLITLAYASAWTPGGTPSWGVWCMIAGSAITMSAATVLGALRSGVRRKLAIAIAIFLLVDIIAGFGIPVLLPAETASSTIILGLPLRAAIEIYGVGLLPFIVLPFLFALEFRSEGLDDASLADLRVRAAAARASGPP